MNFEYDPNKSRSNAEKHGIDFAQAQALWFDPNLVEIQVRTEDEPRYMVIGRISDQYWSGVITYRGNATPVISVRRSRQEEVSLYESI